MNILFGSYKGGQGKSTLATNFAIMLAEQGRDVLLVDSDPQRSTTLWATLRSKAGLTPAVTCMSAYGESVGAEIKKMAPKFDDVVIDTAGHDAIELRSALLAADVLVTPVDIAVFSTATLGEMQGIVRTGRVYNPMLRCFLVPNRVSTHRVRGAAQILRLSNAADELTEYRMTESVIKERVTYSEVVEYGRVVTEGSDGKASKEIRDLFSEICHG